MAARSDQGERRRGVEIRLSSRTMGIAAGGGSVDTDAPGATERTQFYPERHQQRERANNPEREKKGGKKRRKVARRSLPFDGVLDSCIAGCDM